MKISIVPVDRKMLERLGAAAVVFFLLKGLLWIAAPFLFMYAI